MRGMVGVDRLKLEQDSPGLAHVHRPPGASDTYRLGPAVVRAWLPAVVVVPAISQSFEQGQRGLRLKSLADLLTRNLPLSHWSMFVQKGQRSDRSKALLIC